MNVYEAIRSRRSIRHYVPGVPMPRETYIKSLKRL